ncbi:MAG: UDP-N-acetylglucosamine 2-epimerase (non-hydrolyzing) [Desulfobacteraceae bacterium]|nr:MAG: UDP-N-acetylglucosamine 2-epimerase (non-hydrolyzing) [Desulfobacteraceae bacterium]
MKIMSVVGARPNFMKIAPFLKAVMKHNRSHGSDMQIDHYLVHTGQHYDARMSEAFFDALDIPRPDIDLGIGSGSHAEQVGRTMIAFEEVVRRQKPDWVVVVGDVNATCACSITAKKEHVQLAHIEAGLRSFDLDMPEEINRMVTDRLSDLLFTTDEIASENLRKEGVPEKKIKMVGNIMIDTLEAHRELAMSLKPLEIAKSNAIDAIEADKINGNYPGSYAVMTMHRPSNVDEESVLKPLIHFIVNEIAADLPVIWAIHPRTMKQIDAFHLLNTVRTCRNVILMQPLGYHEMLRLNMEADLMLTDSGGLQEECCVLGTPCLTMRWNTERPITLREHGGASVLVGNNVERLREEYANIRKLRRSPVQPPLWDGKTAERIVRELASTRRVQNRMSS